MKKIDIEKIFPGPPLQVTYSGGRVKVKNNLNWGNIALFIGVVVIAGFLVYSHFDDVEE